MHIYYLSPRPSPSAFCSYSDQLCTPPTLFLSYASQHLLLLLLLPPLLVPGRHSNYNVGLLLHNFFFFTLFYRKHNVKRIVPLREECVGGAYMVAPRPRVPE